ncbi:MAG: LPXTG cell wall anchor domain-containing protein [archaeon]
MKNKSLIIFALLIILIGNVSALGVTPARTTIDFEPGLKRVVNFSVVNSESKDMSLIISPQGELNASISLKENSVTMSSSEQSRQLSYEVTLPNDLSPGLHIAEVVILQLPEKSKTSEAYVGAALAVVTQLYVYVPYPGKYAEADLNIVNAEQGGDAVFIIPVVNRGEFDLVSVKANIDIYNKLNEKITSFNTATISVASKERKELVSKWKADAPVGIYRAVVTLTYDGETINLEKQFNIGKEELELQQLEVNDFNLGDIAKLEMLVENKWSEQISGAYAQMQIYNAQNDLIADFNSANYDIPALSKKLIISYWDTAGVKPATYEAKVFLKYRDTSSQKNLQLKVSENRIEVIGLGYVVSSEVSTGDSNLIFILVVGIIVLILINLLWFLLLRKKLNK